MSLAKINFATFFFPSLAFLHAQQFTMEITVHCVCMCVCVCVYECEAIYQLNSHIHQILKDKFTFTFCRFSFTIP